MLETTLLLLLILLLGATAVVKLRSRLKGNESARQALAEFWGDGDDALDDPETDGRAEGWLEIPGTETPRTEGRSLILGAGLNLEEVLDLKVSAVAGRRLEEQLSDVQQLIQVCLQNGHVRGQGIHELVSGIRPLAPNDRLCFALHYSKDVATVVLFIASVPSVPLTLQTLPTH